MAKKKNPEIATVPLTDPNEVANNAATFIRTIGPAAQQTDVQTGRAGTRAGFIDILTGGASITNPTGFQAFNQFRSQNAPSAQQLIRQQNLTRRQSELQAMLESGVGKNGKPLTAAQRANIETRLNRVSRNLTNITTEIDSGNQAVQKAYDDFVGSSPNVSEVMRQADPEFYANVDRAQGIANTIGQMSPEGQRFLDASGQGYQAGTIGAQSVTAAQMGPIANVGAQQVQAARMGDFGRATSRDISAGQVGAGMLGQSLMQRAMTGIERGGLLSPQATRDAIQSARQGFAARGLATGNAALGAELLNRDRFARVREMEDLNFASGVQTQDLGRQFQNVGNQLAADQANQSAAMQAELANLQARYNAAVQEGNWQQAAAISNQDATLRADMANQQTAFNTGQFNTQQANVVGISNADRTLNAATANENARRLGTITNNEMLYNAAGYTDGQRAAGLGASLQMAGVQQSANPLFRLLGSNPYAGGYGSQAVGPGSQLAGGVAQLNAGANEFNANATNYATFANAFRPSFNSSLTGSPWGDFALQTGVAGAQVAGQALLAKSDRRLKENIKPVSKAGGVLGLTTYRFDYKDGKKGVIGFMAQEVQKVLPEAVVEFWENGKKYLGIKPEVIGKAIADELMAQAEAA